MNTLKDITIKKIAEFIYEIPQDKACGMRVPGVIFASDKMIKDIINDGSALQVKNAASLPQIVKASIAMPDIHYGYGLPIGGVVATDIDKGGVLTPGGVGFDINCGVRLTIFDILKNDIIDILETLAKNLFRNIPAGVGEGGNITLNEKEFKDVLTDGAKWAVNKGFGVQDDLTRIESYGSLSGANPDIVSRRAYERGFDQVGTLGSGNHFLEIGFVDDIYNENIANTWGIEKDKITLLVHSGSRGLGHQICTDFLNIFEQTLKKYNISVPDRQLACAPFYSDEAKDYFGALKGAANYAWANRQVLGSLAIKVIADTTGITIGKLNPQLIYDLAHNIVKIEEHNVDGKLQKLAVHRKGATRALPPLHKELPEIYINTGQPVIIPGDMGRYSYILVGAENAAKLSFNSTCHGAGRLKSRHKAITDSAGRNIAKELKEKGIYVIGRGKKTLNEEMPEAYKDVSEVVNVVDSLNLAKKVAKIKPLCVIKG